MASTTLPGRQAATPEDVPVRGWLQTAKRTYAQANKDHLGVIAAGVAFYGFLALIPLLGALVLTYGLLVDPTEVARQMHDVTALVPGDAAKLIDEQLHSIVATAASKKGFGLALALLLAIYGAMKGAGAIITALNAAYEEEETRGFFRLNLVQAAITLAAVLLAIAGLFSASITGVLSHLAGALGPIAAVAIKVGSWVITAALASGAVAALYRYAPNRKRARWAWLTPGSIFATLGFIAATYGFGLYVAKFGNYNATYGSLGAIVVLLTWLYLSAYILLLGAELNAELDRQTTRDPIELAETPLHGHGANSANGVA